MTKKTTKKSSQPSKVIDVNGRSFRREVLNSDLPVLVDFYADWCGPCVMTGPIVDKISVDYAGKLKVCRFDVDKRSKVVEDLRIMAIPSFIFFRDGKEFARTVGALITKEMRAFVEKGLKG